MTNDKHTKWTGLAVMVAAGIFLMTQNAAALEGAYTRTGGFTGIGFSAGGAFISGDSKTGVGDLGLNLQLGMGASENVAVALNVDTSLQVGNDLTQGMIVPGPRILVFLGKNAFISAGVGVAFGLKVETENHNAVGMNVGGAVGFEKFVNTNLAAYFSGGVEYYLLKDASNVTAFILSVGIRYY